MSYIPLRKKTPSKYIKDLSIRPKIVKLLEGKKIPEVGLGYHFFDKTLKAQATKMKIKKGGHIKPKNFYTAKETIN